MKKRMSKFGRSPINARIEIQYPEKGKPKIKFNYIAEKQQSSSLYFNYLTLSLTVITILILLGIYLSWPNDNVAPLKGVCNVSELSYSGDDHIFGWKIVCENDTYFLDYRKGYGLYPFGTSEAFYPRYDNQLSKVFEDNLWLATPIAAGLMIAAFALYFGLLYFYGWLFQAVPFLRARANRWIPELNKKLASAKWMATFKTCPETKIIEIPLFSNIFLDYDAQGEFSRYLQKVEIKEHPFSMLAKKSFFGRIKSKSKSKSKSSNPNSQYKKKHNVYLWRARFIFREVPRKGRLEVRWA